MMDIYASVGRAEEAESMMNQMDPNDPVKYTLLVRAYGKSGRADLANDVVFSRMPQDPKIIPSPLVYIELILAWARSKQDDAMKQAYSVILFIDESEFCKQHNIRPDSSMFVALLDCVGASHCKDPGFQVLAVLDDIELRSRENSELQLNQEIYDASLNVCLHEKRKDLKTVEAILKRIEKSDFVSHMSFYNDVLNRLLSFRSIEAAECAERTLLNLREFSKSNSQLKPNANNYNAVISCWIDVDDTSSSKRAWTIYEKMEHDSVLPTMRTFTTMIVYFAKSIWGRVDVSRADRLLTLMESGEITGVAPDRRHYGSVMNGWIALGELDIATDVFFRLIKAYIGSTGSMKQQLEPTSHNIYAVATRWIAVDELVKATDFVEQMQTLHDKNQLPVGPDIYTYLELHSAWSQSESPDAAQHIEKLDATMGRIRPIPEKKRKLKLREKKPV
jgi:Pentatricopeptide repeat domain